MEQARRYLYPRQKICGIWLIIVGLSMFTLLNNGYKHPILFTLLYILGMVFQLNPITRKKLSVGVATSKQKVWSNLSMVILFVSCLIGFFLSNGNIMNIWLALMLAVGIHFFFFIPVHGKFIGILGLLTTLNALLAIFINGYHLDTAFIVDGCLKCLFGFIMFFFSPIDF